MLQGLNDIRVLLSNEYS